ncbi:MAG: hypothetical protein JSW73_05695 [Candidatus Woesearchaeota archaeon]|nr:MAG: hypothetical protein JSW73_05695 [Candidatus Woesearchaeota archaeon]
MVKSQKDVFWKAAILTIAVFSLGMFIGYSFERGRVFEIEEDYNIMKLRQIDANLQTLYYNNMVIQDSKFCEVAIDENIKFADELYEEGVKIERYLNANKITKDLLINQKEYILFKTQFWLNAISLKKKCYADYVNVVYFYKQKSEDFDVNTDQNVMSGMLFEIKQGYGPEIMLIPLAVDLNISTIDIVVNQYNITEYPALLINEETVMQGLHNKNEIIEEIDKFL